MEIVLNCLRLLICATCLTSFAPIAAKTNIDPDVANVISRTRETQATYALYLWNEVSPKNAKPFAEWSAEFHSGHLHRVETPKVRVIANCKTMIGTYIEIETGERLASQRVAKSACGIDANPEIFSARKLGIRKTAFGEAVVIEIVDSSVRRTYHVSKDGVLLGATIRDKGKNGHVLLINKALHVDSNLPKGNIFSEQSLDRSVVAERYRAPVVKNSQVD